MDWTILNCYEMTEEEKDITKKMTREQMIDELREDVYGGVEKEDLFDEDLLEEMLQQNFRYLCDWERG